LPPTRALYDDAERSLRKMRAARRLASSIMTSGVSTAEAVTEGVSSGLSADRA
jgi:hypothetical protein